MSNTADEMNMGDGVAIKVEQIKPWSETLSPEERDKVRGEFAKVLEMPSRDCQHVVLLDITSLCSIQKISGVHHFVLHPFPKGVTVFECNACGEIGLIK